MKVRLLQAAELDEAVAWYRDRGDGLAERFLAELASARDAIIANPNAWHPLGEGIRRFRLNHFPYGLIYVVEDEGVLILAVAHHSRRPDYWRDRALR
jgi:plasmid stabilization system protein ParE